MRELFIVCENWNVEEEEGGGGGGIFDGIFFLGGDKRERPIRNGWEKEREREMSRYSSDSDDKEALACSCVGVGFVMIGWCYITYPLNINTSSNDYTLYTASFMQEKGYFKNEGLKGGAFNF